MILDNYPFILIIIFSFKCDDKFSAFDKSIHFNRGEAQ